MKKLFAPLRMLADAALLAHLPDGHPARPSIEDDFAIRHAGWRGEQTMAYYLDHLPDDPVRIFFDLQLPAAAHFFQMDALILFPSFALIIESKNFSGTIYFESTFNQMIRVIDNHQESFANPIVQAARHRDMLAEFLTARGLSRLPIECLVVISNSSTMIKASPDHHQMGHWVCHADQIESRVKKLNDQHQRRILSLSELRHLEKALLREHTDPSLNVLSTFHVPFEELVRGIQCPSCGKYNTERAYGTWICTDCAHVSRFAHVPMVLDYFLLNGSTMSNRQCRAFLKIKSRQLVTRLLNRMHIPAIESAGRSIIYSSPPHEFFDQNFHHIVRNHENKKVRHNIRKLRSKHSN